VSEDTDDAWEINPTFCDCTCEHDQDDHTWGVCAVEGCPCEGGWEE